MAKNLNSSKWRKGSKEIQLSTSNGGSNYELLLEEAVIAQKSLQEFQEIQIKLNQKINSLNNRINTQQNILNDLFHDSNSQIPNDANSRFFTINDLNLLNQIKNKRLERFGNGGQRVEQYQRSDDIIKSNVSSNSSFPYKNLNKDDEFNENRNHNDKSNSKSANKSFKPKNLINNNSYNDNNKNNANKKSNNNYTYGFNSNINMEELQNSLKNNENKNSNSFNASKNSSFYQNHGKKLLLLSY